MVSLSTWFRYVVQKFDYSLCLTWNSYIFGKISESEVGDAVWKYFYQGRLTYLHWNKGEEMAPTVAAKGATLLVRKFPALEPRFRRIFVGDIILLKDPEKADDYLVRRVAAMEGYEMVSTRNEDTPFVLEKDECWVVSDNKTLKPKEARDSRTFGPIPTPYIVGRVIYSLRTAVDHGPVQNSCSGMYEDFSLLAVELDVDEMVKNHKV